MAAPINTVAPAITGTVEVGGTLSCSTGTWTGAISYAYQWQSSNPGSSSYEAVLGATSNTYVIQAGNEGQTLQCNVTATNVDGSTSAASSPTTAVPNDYLIVEDATGKTDANSFVSLAAADTYHASRNNTSWGALTIGNRKAALIRASDYMEQEYRLRWKGTRLKGTQSLSWPRAYVPRPDYFDTGSTPPDSVDGTYYYPSDEIPREVLNACCEFALRASASALNADYGRVTTREKVDVIEVEYSEFGPQYMTYRALDQLLAPLLTVSNNTAKVVRS